MSRAVALRPTALLLAALLAGTGCATAGRNPTGSAPAGGSNAPIASGAGTSVPATADPTLRSALVGFAIGSAAGPIGSLVGAGIGYGYGLYARREMQRQMEREALRQKEIDQDLARQVEGRQAGQAGEPGSAPLAGDREQGVRIVKDHLAPAPAVASRPEPAPPAPPTPKVDAEGFVPIYAGSRLVRRERDADGDGKPDVIVHIGDDGQPARREESSQLDGRFDTVSHYRDGRIARRESDTDGDGRPDIWAEYDPEGRPARTEALLSPDRKLVQVYADGRVAREEWHRLPEDRIEARLIYGDGRVVQKEEDSTGAGVLDLISVLDEQGRVVKQGRRTAEGRLVAWRYFATDGGAVVREEELAADGQVTAIAYYENGRLARRELYELDDALIRRAVPAPRLAETQPDGGG